MVHEIWSTIDRIVLILNHFLPFYPSMDQESQNFEKMKRTPWDIIILHMCTINDNHDVWFLRYGAQRTEYLPFWIIFCHFTLPHHLPPTNNPENQNFEKVKKNSWRQYHFTHVYHKWQSYDVWFLRYGAQQKKWHTEVGVPPKN